MLSSRMKFMVSVGWSHIRAGDEIREKQYHWKYLYESNLRATYGGLQFQVVGSDQAQRLSADRSFRNRLRGSERKAWLVQATDLEVRSELIERIQAILDLRELTLSQVSAQSEEFSAEDHISLYPQFLLRAAAWQLQPKPAATVRVEPNH